MSRKRAARISEVKYVGIVYKMKLPKKVHWFVMTDWNCLEKDDYMKVMAKHDVKFLAYGKEIAPSTGKKHHQCYLYFKHSRAWGKLALKRIGGWWGETHNFVDAQRGNVDANELYCQKEGELVKLGTEPKQGQRGDINDTCAEIMKGNVTVDDIAIESPMHYHQYGRTFEKIQTIYLRTKWRTWRTEGIWYFGNTQCGKSHQMYKDYHPKTHFIKNLNEKWWDGYQGQEIICINEFKGQITYGELMDLVDKWAKNVSSRHRENVPFLAKKVIIASITRVEECYYNRTDFSEFYERFKLFECTKNDGKYAVQQVEPIICDVVQTDDD